MNIFTQRFNQTLGFIHLKNFIFITHSVKFLKLLSSDNDSVVDFYFPCFKPKLKYIIIHFYLSTCLFFLSFLSSFEESVTFLGVLCLVFEIP